MTYMQPPTTLVEHRATGEIQILAERPDNIDAHHYRVISPLRRDHGYTGFVFTDQWGGVWRQSPAVENISNAMEKWA